MSFNEFSGSLMVGGLTTIDDEVLGDDDDLDSFMTGLSMTRTALRRNGGGCIIGSRANWRYERTSDSSNAGYLVWSQSRYVKPFVGFYVWPSRDRLFSGGKSSHSNFGVCEIWRTKQQEVQIV